MTLSKDAAKSLVERTLAFSKADACAVTLDAGRTSNIRFARNEVTTSGDTDDVGVSVTASFGKRSGSASVNQTDAASLERCVRQAEETARFAPEDPEKMPLLAPQTYAEIRAYDEATVDLPPERRAALAKESIALAKEKGVVIAGYYTNGGGPRAIGNSNGLFGHHPQSRVTFSATARTPDGRGSGWAGGNGETANSLDSLALSRAAVEKAFGSADAKEIPAGTYTVILEPSAVADLLLYMAFMTDARSADEGRSFFSAKGGGNKLGKKVLSNQVTIWTDPADPRAPGSPFSGDGLPTRKITYFDKGVLTHLTYSRFWAEKKGKQPTPENQNVFMQGGSGSVADLIAGTKKGVLLTRLWYIRFVDPQTMLLTGLTRDGSFRIENGRIAGAVKNFRWNDSPVSIFSKIDGMSAAVRARGSESEDFAIVCPAIRTQFSFSSLSDAV